MKKFAAVAVVLLFALLLINVFGAADGMHFVWDGDEIDGPLGVVVGLFAGGLGLLVAGCVLAFVGIVLAAVFAGLGLMAVLGLAIGAIAVVAMVAPLLLPIALPIAVIAWLANRSRRNRAKQAALNAPL